MKSTGLFQKKKIQILTYNIYIIQVNHVICYGLHHFLQMVAKGLILRTSHVVGDYLT